MFLSSMKEIKAEVKNGKIVSSKLSEFIEKNEGQTITLGRYYQPSTQKQHRLLMGYVYPNILMQTGMFNELPERKRRAELHRFFLEQMSISETEYKNFNAKEFNSWLRNINSFCIDNSIDMDPDNKLDIYY